MELDEDLTFTLDSTGNLQTKITEKPKDTIIENKQEPVLPKNEIENPNLQNELMKALNILKDLNPTKQQKLLSTIGQLAKNSEEELKTDEELKNMSPEERRKELKRRIHKKNEMGKMIKKTQTIMTRKV